MKAPRLTDDHTGERIENFRARMMVFVALGLLLVVAGLLLYAKDYISVGAVRVWLLLTPLYSMRFRRCCSA
jgi:hypothetical protein